MRHSNRAATITKANANYVCQECGATEYLQAHHTVPGDDTSLICLCAMCHSKQHPDIPQALFLTESQQPFWNNKSASTLAKQFYVHPRTVIRAARCLKIDRGLLSPLDEEAIKQKLQPGMGGAKNPIPVYCDQPQNKTMWSVKEAAKELGVSGQRIRKLLAQGRLKGKRLSGVWVVLELSYAKGSRIKIHQCFRCGHVWPSKRLRPNICPKCKSTHWAERKAGHAYMDGETGQIELL